MPCRDVAVAVNVDEPSDAVLRFAFHAAELRRAQLRAVHTWRVPFSHGFADAEARARCTAEESASWRSSHRGTRSTRAAVVKEELHEGWLAPPLHCLLGPA
jgi:hypothetical protein